MTLFVGEGQGRLQACGEFFLMVSYRGCSERVYKGGFCQVPGSTAAAAAGEAGRTCVIGGGG